MSTVGADDVCTAVLNALTLRLPAAIDQLNERPAAPVQLDPIRNFRLVADFDERSAEGQIPQVAVDSPGFGEPPAPVSDDSSRLAWTIVATCLQRGQNTQQTILRTMRYVTAMKLALLRSSPIEIDGRWCDVQLVAASYDEVDVRSARTLGAGFVEISVHVPNAIDLTDLDATPPVPVTSAIVTVTRRRPPP
jgi:hypothetical protein